MLGVHASGVCTGIGRSKIGRTSLPRKKLTSLPAIGLPVQKHRGEQGHTHRDEHTEDQVSWSRRTRYQSGATDRRGRPQRTPLANPHNEPNYLQLSAPSPGLAPRSASESTSRVCSRSYTGRAIWGRRNRIFNSYRFLSTCQLSLTSVDPTRTVASNIYT